MKFGIESAQPASCLNTSSESAASRPVHRVRGLLTITAAWLVLATMMVSLAWQNVTVPGLYYDEAVFAGLAKDAMVGQIHGQHMPGCEVISVFGHPFPLFIQSYLGALKSWLLMPSFGLFGSSLTVLRLTTLGWSLLALLLMMLWTWRWLGAGEALLAGAILATDPTYFFLSLLDWGGAIPGFLCRFACFYLVWLWWQHRRRRYALLAGFLAGLCFFNKIDSVVPLAAAALAVACCYGRPSWAFLRARPLWFALPCFGFLLGAGPMMFKVPVMLDWTASGTVYVRPGELQEKLHTMLTMYDGSHFYRLMDLGGVFQKMDQAAAAAWSPFGVVFCLACLVLVFKVGWDRSGDSRRRVAVFLILTIFLVTLGIYLLPGAVRIHHAVLAFPFPQLIVAAALTAVWKVSMARRRVRWTCRVVLSAGVVMLLLGQLLAIQRTQRLIRETGGRGRWSESLDAFCRQVKDRTDLTIVSLDWGFNEQLIFLTDGPQLFEPFWPSELNTGRSLPAATNYVDLVHRDQTGAEQPLARLPAATNYVYLVHPPEYSLFPFGPGVLEAASAAGRDVEIQPYRDRQNRVAFYAIRFLSQ